MKRYSSAKIGLKQKKFFFILIAGCVGLVGLLVSFTSDGDAKEVPLQPKNESEISFNTVSQEVDAKTVRISALENLNDALISRVASLEKSLEDLQDDTSNAEEREENLSVAIHAISQKLQALEEDLHQPVPTEIKKSAP